MAAPRLIVPLQIETMTFPTGTLAATQRRIEIPRDQMVGAIELRAAGDVTAAGGAASGAALADAPFSLFNRIQVKGGGRDSIKDLSWATLAALNRINHGVAANQSTNGVDGTAAANQLFTANGRVEFLTPERRFLEPLDTVLDAPLLYRNSILELIIDTRDKKGLVNGTNDRTYTVNSLSVAVVLERIIIQDAAEQARVGFLMPIEITDRIFDLTATSTNQRLDVDQGLQYRQILLRSLLETGASHDTFNPTDAILNQWRLRAGTESFLDEPANINRAKLLRRLGFSADQTGVYLYDPTPAGKIKEALPTEGLTDLHHELDVTKGANTNRLEFTSYRYLPVTQKLQAAPVARA